MMGRTGMRNGILALALLFGLAAIAPPGGADDLEPVIDGPQNVVKYVGCAFGMGLAVVKPGVGTAIGAVLACTRLYMEQKS